MKKRLLGICSRTTLICLEVLAVLVGLLFLAGGVLVWRLTTGPVNVDFAKNYIEQALHDPVSGYSVKLDHVVVEWPDLHGPIVLELGGVDLIKNNVTVLGIDNVTLGLATRYLFVGDIEPVTIALEKPKLHLIRTDKNEIRLSLEDGEEQADAQNGDENNPLMRIIDTLSSPAGSVDKRSPIDHLKSVEIKKAQMVIADYKLGITWFLSPIDLTFARDVRGLIVSASVELPGGRDKASQIQADLVYSRNTKDFKASIYVQDFDPHILSSKIEDLAFLEDQYAILNGNIDLSFDRNFHVYRAGVSLSSRDGELVLKDVYDKPLRFDEMYLDASYDEQQGLADLKEFTLKTNDVAFSVSSPVKFTSSSFKAPITITVPELPQEKISALWPAALRGEGAEIWLTQKLSKGTFHNTKIAFDTAGEKKDGLWSVDVKNVKGGMTFDKMDIDYRAPLRAITNASGTGTFANDTLTIDIDKAALGDMAVGKSKAVITKVIADDGGMADINVNIGGPLQSVLRYIQPEPIGISEEKLGLKIAAVKGRADLSVNVSFPTIKDLPAEKVKVKAEGTLNDVLLPDVVKKLDLTGGPFALKIADGAASISGKGRLEGRPIDFSWQEYVDPEGKPFVSQVKAQMLADKGLRDGFGIGLEDWIDGAFPVNVTYTEYGPGKADADVRADLSAGRLMIGLLDYVREPGKPATATCKVVFRGGYVQEVQNLDIDAAPLRIKNARFVFDTVGGEASLRRASLPDFQLEENQFAVDMEFTKNDMLKMSVKGPFLDARPFLKDKKKKEPYDGPRVVASIAVDRMRTQPARMVDKAKVYLDMNKQGNVDQFELDAVAGKGDIYLRLKPNDKGLMSVRFEADDAGAALRAFDMYENVKGGKIKLYGEAESKSDPRTLKGNAELTDFTVVKAPVLAQLVNAISLIGIQQLLGGEGIYFSRLESKFVWHMDRNGDQYYFKDGRTSGSSLGLTFDGRIDKSADLVKMEGTIVPVSMVSELISNIPLIGDILTGGGGGLIAATYKIEGPIKKPEVSVNPLSVLAPGILRKILFEGD